MPGRDSHPHRLRILRRFLVVLWAAHHLLSPDALGLDWPQLQRDAGRTGHTSDSVPPPYRARWIWLGPHQTLRNRDSQTGWPDDLRSRPGYTYPNLPNAVPFTFADSVQPVLSNQRIFVGSLEGQAWAIAADDGTTLWQAAVPGGTAATAAVVDDVVVFAGLDGIVSAFRTDSGAVAWSHDTGRALTGAPCAVGQRVLVGAHDGRVTALSPRDGTVLWRSPRLPAPILGGLCADDSTAYVGAENLVVYALRLADGSVRASHPVRGQSFRMEWPVVNRGRVWVTTVTTPIIGSEYIGETNSGSSLFLDGHDLASEEANLRRWLAGDTHGGRWPDAGRDWRHLFVLDTRDLGEPFVVATGPADGVGVPVAPPVIDETGRALTYFKTRFPFLTRANGGVFGTRFTVDLAYVDPVNGNRIPIDHGHLANLWPWETDNLYGLSLAGSQLWLRQNFRGTQMIDLATSTARGVSAAIRTRDGGTFNFDVVYRDREPDTRTASPTLLGRIPPIVVDDRVYFTENWGVTALEHAP